MIASIWAAVAILLITLLRAAALRKTQKPMFLILWGAVLLRLLIPLRFNIAASTGYELPPVFHEAAVSQAQRIGGFALPMWAFIAVALFLFFIVSYIKRRCTFKHATNCRDARIYAVLSQNMRLRRKINVKLCAEIVAPLTYGVLRPVILLPNSALKYTTVQLNHILAHELVHIKRFDMLWKWLLIIAACLHWFNPCVWLMLVLANRDLEISCDEAAIKSSGGSKYEYAHTLLTFVQVKSAREPIMNTFNRNPIEERIKAIMKSRKSRPLGSALTYVAALCVILVVASSCVTAKPEVTEPAVRLTSSSMSFDNYRDFLDYIKECGDKITEIQRRPGEWDENSKLTQEEREQKDEELRSFIAYHDEIKLPYFYSDDTASVYHRDTILKSS